VPMIERHLGRLRDSAQALGFECDRHAIRNDIQAVCFTRRIPARLRITLFADGKWTIMQSPLPDAPEEPVPVAVEPLPVSPEDWRLRHKSSERYFYTEALQRAQQRGAFEAVLRREDGLLTEGCFTNLFVERDGILLTPALSLGLLPGVLRGQLIEEGRAQEAELTEGDLSEGLLIGNSLRGLIRARLIG